MAEAEYEAVVPNDSGTPTSYRLRQAKADGVVESKDVNMEVNQAKNKRMRAEFFETFKNAAKQRVLNTVSGNLTEQEKTQRKLDLALARKGKYRRVANQSKLEKVGRQLGSERSLRLQGGANHQNPLIQVGRQAPNRFLVNKPFTGQAVIENSKLRRNNYPIVSRPTNFINSLSAQRRPSPFDKYRKTSGRYI